MTMENITFLEINMTELDHFGIYRLCRLKMGFESTTIKTDVYHY
ncbi:hypothetical protein J2S07_002199 [Robertmurraya andreesenii]|uniref:Transposase n=1 Tax=Anoxybacillus andreesenii TaxID=1325932 RepID=A0ABT9V4K9_9BACL|nr:hypothetical protein [Robertmurraya andreesenii]